MPNDQIGLEIQHQIPEFDLHFESILTSRSPLTSILTVNTSNLCGITVSCLDEIDSSESEHRTSIAVHGMFHTYGPSSYIVMQAVVNMC